MTMKRTVFSMFFGLCCMHVFGQWVVSAPSLEIQEAANHVEQMQPMRRWSMFGKVSTKESMP